VHVESHTFARVVVTQSQRTSTRARTDTRPHARRHHAASQPSHRVPHAPSAPTGPPAPTGAGSGGGGDHDGGGSALTAALAATLALVALGLLGSIVPISSSVRRRLSDDRRARPG
jgi:hypothetical protein